jgi:hypothetical protein
MKWNTPKASCAFLITLFVGFGIGKRVGSIQAHDEAEEWRKRLLENGMVSTSRTKAKEFSRESSDANGRIARFERTLNMSVETDRKRALLSLCSTLDSSQFEELMSCFQALGLRDIQKTDYYLVLAEWAKCDINAAVRYFHDVLSPSANVDTSIPRKTFLPVWVATDPDAAIAWAKSNHQGGGDNPHMRGIIEGLVESDPARATQIIEEMVGEVTVSEMHFEIEMMIERLVKENPNKEPQAVVETWLQGLTKTEVRNYARRWLPTMLSDVGVDPGRLMK